MGLDLPFRRIIGLSITAGIAFACLFLAGQHFIGSPPHAPATVGRDYALRPYLRDADDLSRRHGETPLAYATRMNRAVYESTYHCGHYETGLSYLEGFLMLAAPKQLFLHGLLVRERFECGLCSQRSYMLKEILADEGISSELLFLSNHVVLRSGAVVFDPDFGVGPFRYGDMTTIEGAYRGQVGEWPGFFRYVYERPAMPDQQRRWNRLVESKERVQRLYFSLANVLAAFLAAVGLLLSWHVYSRTSIARKDRDAVTSIDVSELFWKNASK